MKRFPHRFFRSRALLIAVLSLCAGDLTFAATSQVEVNVAAFLQPDAATGKMPFDAVRITRNGTVVASSDVFLPCDVVEFVSEQRLYRDARVTGVRGGQSVVLTSSNPKTTISCAPPTLNAKLTAIWRAISRNSRGINTTTAATRGRDTNELSLPVFAGEEFSIVGGRRGLVVPWTGGGLPAKVTLATYADSEADRRVLATVTAYTERLAVLPPVDLKPGRYVVRVMQLASDCSAPCGLEEVSLYVREGATLPAKPVELARANINANEQALLYSYFLEGASERWLFEAVQLAYPYRADPLVRAWLRKFAE